jgi:hypothetical protein
VIWCYFPFTRAATYADAFPSVKNIKIISFAAWVPLWSAVSFPNSRGVWRSALIFRKLETAKRNYKKHDLAPIGAPRKVFPQKNCPVPRFAQT